MRALLVHAEFPVTYWGMQYALQMVGRRASLPPLGLLTLAALLPEHWELRVVDCNTHTLRHRDLLWADVVLVGGMLIQAPSMNHVLRWAKRVGKRAVVGGSAPSTAPELFPDADVVFRGEAEGRVDDLVTAITAPGRVVLDAPAKRPDMTTSPIPRYDLIDLDLYAAACIQYSRGCPHRCEFCDIIEIFGRKPRVKAPEQIVAELDALVRDGYRGQVFLVDDNFIGNRPAVRKLLPELLTYQRAHDFPVAFFTEASVDLAGDTALLEQMVATGFRAVFVGIETPSSDALKSVKKGQNLRVDLVQAVDTITHAGIEVMGGFIVGFDTDDAEIFEAQRAFIAAAPIPMAMVGLLGALPGTALSRRLETEGRLRRDFGGDNFGRPNFDPVMDEATLLQGYSELMAELYAPEAWYARCEAHIERAGPVPRTTAPPSGRRLLELARSVLAVGVRSLQRRRYWRLLAKGARHSRTKFEWAVMHAVQGEHFIRYTREHVLPSLEAARQAALQDVRPSAVA